MARVTVEDCLRKVEGRFELVHLPAERANMLLHGAKPVVEADNKEIVIALREIAEGKVYFMGAEAEDSEPSGEAVAGPEVESSEGAEKTEGER